MDHRPAAGQDHHVFMVNLLTNRQKHRVPTNVSVHPPASQSESNTDGVESASAASPIDTIKAVMQHHVAVTTSNEVVVQHPEAYATFLDLWLQEGLSRFVVTQKFKKS